MSNVGTTAVAAGGTLNVSGVNGVTLNARTLSNAGLTIWTNSANANTGNGDVINNVAGGTLDFRSNTSIVANQGGAPLTINNTGTILRTTGTLTQTLDAVFNNQSGGQVTVSSGVLNLIRGGTNAGQFTATSPGVLEFVVIGSPLSAL